MPSPSDPSPVSPPTSEARHTPGPWSLGEPVQSCGQMVYVMVLAGKRRLCACSVYGDKSINQATATEAEAMANARLIAAAPDLLAAAEAALPLLLLAAIKAPDRECAKRYSETCGVLTAAIKAAKGGVA